MTAQGHGNGNAVGTRLRAEMKVKMIQITIKDQEFSYDLTALAQAFFPEKKCVVREEEVWRGRDGYTVCWEIDGERAFEHFEPSPYTRNTVKRKVYDLLSRYLEKELPWGTLTGVRPAKIPLRMLTEGMPEEEIDRILREEYRCSREKSALVLDVAKREYAITSGIDHENSFCLYIGIPFCPSICAYCSFSSYLAGKYEKWMDAYLDALEQELSYAAKTFAGKKLQAVYIGGGTPTALRDLAFARLLDMVDRYLPMEDVSEYTVEAGRPDSISEEKLQGMKAHRVSRISINPQSMKQRTLDLLGRKHSVEDVKRVYARARELGFDNINMDLIVGLPEETPADFKRTLEEIVRMEPDSVTVHTLVIKRASQMRREQMEQGGRRKEGQRAEGRRTETGQKEERCAGMIQEENRCNETMREENHYIQAMQDEAGSFLREHGYGPYYMYRQKNKALTTRNTNQENVAYAKPGKECLYNIVMMEELETVLALGSGGSTKIVFHGENRLERVENVKNVEQYIERIDEMIRRKQKFLPVNMEV